MVFPCKDCLILTTCNQLCDHYFEVIDKLRSCDNVIWYERIKYYTFKNICAYCGNSIYKKNGGDYCSVCRGLIPNV